MLTAQTGEKKKRIEGREKFILELELRKLVVEDYAHTMNIDLLINVVVCAQTLAIPFSWASVLKRKKCAVDELFFHICAMATANLYFCRRARFPLKMFKRR